MAQIAIEPELLQPRDWNAHYRNVRNRINNARWRDVAVRNPKAAGLPMIQIKDEEPSDKVGETAPLPANPAACEFIKEFCDRNGVTWGYIVQKDRKKPVVLMRNKFIYEYKQKFNPHLTMMGRLMGMDHSSIHHAICSHAKRIGQQ